MVDPGKGAEATGDGGAVDVDQVPMTVEAGCANEFGMGGVLRAGDLDVVDVEECGVRGRQRSAYHAHARDRSDEDVQPAFALLPLDRDPPVANPRIDG